MKQYRARKIKIAAGGRDLSLLVLQPLQPAFRKTPGIVWLHGGGYALGMPEMVYLSRALPLVERGGCFAAIPAGGAPSLSGGVGGLLCGAPVFESARRRTGLRV